MIHGIFYKKPKSQSFRALVENNHTDLVLNPTYQQTVSTSLPNMWLAQAIEKKATMTKDPCLASLGLPPQAMISFWGRIDNRNDIAQKIGINVKDISTMTSSDLVLRAYLKWGDFCTTYLLGDFCFAIYDVLENRLLCARDPMGIKPFYYYDSNELFVFSSSLALFHRLPELPIKPRLEWASQYLLNNSLSMDFEKTAYQSIFKLAPAYQCCVTKDNMTKKRYFSFHTDKIQLKSSEEYVEFYQEKLNEALKYRVQEKHPLGSELSGGIDSSTVTAYAIKHYLGSLNNFHAFGFVHYEHEPNHILRVSQYLGIPVTHICCNHLSVDQRLLQPLKTLGAPIQHRNSVGHEIFYNLGATHGIKTLLSGFGGDEFVTSIHGYLYLHELIKNKQYAKLHKNLSGGPLLRTLKFVKYIWNNQRGVTSQSMMNAYNQRWPSHVVKDNLIEIYGLKEAYQAQGLFNFGYSNFDQFTLENRLAPFISTRTEECTLMAGTYGIEYRWPLLDVNLIQAFLSIPTHEKYHRGIGRYLHKRAIADHVPKNIIEQNSKYMGKPIASIYPTHTTLNQDLHPLLLMLVNQPKLLAQEKYLMKLMNKEPSNLNLKEQVPMRQNIYRVNALDDWLKHYFATGYDWSST